MSQHQQTSETSSIMAFVPVSSFAGVRVVGRTNAVCQAPTRAAKWTMGEGGKGFGGGEATRE